MTSLPTPVAAYVAARNQHDVERMHAAFAPTAVVKDAEYEDELRGADAIRRWLEETTTTYHPTMEVLAPPLEPAPAQRVVVVGVRVSGDFPGSPVELRHAFTVDGGLISRLEITA